MKTMLRVVLAVIFISGFAFGQGQISGSDHDFTTKGWNGSGELCNVCHTPHDAIAGVSPLWNHAVTISTFSPYTSTTLNATVAGPDGASKLCLSCHDGSVAVDSYGGTTGTTFLSGNKNLGTDLTNDHPISFTYDDALATADGGLVLPSANTTLAGLLTGGKMECSSCHDVHNGSGLSKLLVMSNAGSALCLTCHSK